jgi:hypothetical protein
MSNPASPSDFSRRRLLAAGVSGAATASGLVRAGAVWAAEGPPTYKPTWPSADQHPPAAEWFQDAKFGIYYHWGVFRVPAFASEWYPRNVHIAGSAENKHHRSVQGHSSAWLYSMWDSAVNAWNSVRTGPGLDRARLHADAIRAKGMRLIMGSGSFTQPRTETRQDIAYAVKQTLSASIPTAAPITPLTAWATVPPAPNVAMWAPNNRLNKPVDHNNCLTLNKEAHP